MKHYSGRLSSIMIVIGIFFMLINSCGNKSSDEPNPEMDLNLNKKATATIPPPGLTYKIIDKIPHDISAYTQGLIYFNDYLYESTGQYFESSIRKVNPATGDVLKKASIPDAYFGEGIAIFENTIYMLTWQSRQCMIINLETFKIENTFSYSGEGWGLTDDGTSLIMSDGTSLLKFIDPSSRTVTKTVPVSFNSRPVSQLNELEYIDGKIWANIYNEDRIAVINPVTGNIENIIDFSELRNFERGNPHAEVLNGIAYNKITKEIYLTGKNWSYYYRIKIN